MEPKAREWFNLGLAKNHLEFVDTGRMIISRNATWAHVPFGRFPAAQSKPLEEGEGDDNH